MPIFDFKCTKCGKVKEIMVKMKDSDSVHSCECGYVMKKQLGACSFKIGGYSAANGYGELDPNRGVEQW